MRDKRPSTASPPPSKRIRLSSSRLDAARLPDAIAALPHVMESIDAFSMEPDEALVKAAQNGNLGSVASILSRWEISHESKVEAAAAAAAATQSHPTVLLELREDMDEINRVYSAWEILDEACYRGNLKVVEAVATYAKEEIDDSDGHYQRRAARDWGYILTNAVIGGNVDVVQFLLSVENWHLDVGEVFDQALHDGKTEMAEVLREVYPRHDYYDVYSDLDSEEEDDVLVPAASAGHIHIVKYFHSLGHASPEVLNDAFNGAVKHPKVMKFLFLKGCITSMTTNTTFILAARMKELASVRFLYDLCCNVPSVVNEAFISAASWTYEGDSKAPDVLEYLFSKDCVTSSSVENAFVSAASRGNIGTVKYIHSKCGVSSKVINAVFIDVAAHGQNKMLRHLNELDCILLDSVKSAFLETAKHSERKCVGFLYQNRFTFAKDLIQVARGGEENDIAEFLRTQVDVNLATASLVKEAMEIAKRGSVRDVQLFLDSHNRWITEAHAVSLNESKRFLNRVLGIPSRKEKRKNRRANRKKLKERLS